MTLTLVRKQYRADGIFGELYDPMGDFICVTLEHAYQQQDLSYLPKIPIGLFECVRGPHRLAGMADTFETFEITNVPGHTNLLFHWGNFNKDSEGCILVGESVAMSGKEMITNSRAAFVKFLAAQKGASAFKLQVISRPEEIIKAGA